MKTFIFLAFIAVAPLSAIAAEPVDNYAADAVVAARYAEAVTMLQAHVAKDPMDESALINLAIAYRHTGRAAEAQAMYRRVLQLENVMLDTAKGRAMSSHDVARRGLGLGTQLSLR